MFTYYFLVWFFLYKHTTTYLIKHDYISVNGVPNLIYPFYKSPFIFILTDFEKRYTSPDKSTEVLLTTKQYSDLKESINQRTNLTLVINPTCCIKIKFLKDYL